MSATATGRAGTWLGPQPRRTWPGPLPAHLTAMAISLGFGVTAVSTKLLSPQDPNAIDQAPRSTRHCLVLPEKRLELSRAIQRSRKIRIHNLLTFPFKGRR